MALGVGALLTSGALVGLAERQPVGAQRDVALQAAEAADRVANLLSLNRPADELAAALDGEEQIYDVQALIDGARTTATTTAEGTTGETGGSGTETGGATPDAGGQPGTDLASQADGLGNGPGGDDPDDPGTSSGPPEDGIEQLPPGCVVPGGSGLEGGPEGRGDSGGSYETGGTGVTGEVGTDTAGGGGATGGATGGAGAPGEDSPGATGRGTAEATAEPGDTPAPGGGEGGSPSISEPGGATADGDAGADGSGTDGGVPGDPGVGETTARTGDDGAQVSGVPAGPAGSNERGGSPGGIGNTEGTGSAGRTGSAGSAGRTGNAGNAADTAGSRGLGNTGASAGAVDAVECPPGTEPTGTQPTGTTPTPPASTTSTSAAVPTTTTGFTAPRTPEPGEPLRMYAGGDSISRDLGEGLARVTPTNLVRLDLDPRPATGLSRPDFFDWTQHLAGVLIEDTPDVIVLMFGANDFQDVEYEGRILQRDTDEWLDLYRERVDTMMALASQPDIQTVWVGQPPVREERLAGGLARLNAVYTEQAEDHPQVTFVDSWALFSDDEGNYADELDGVRVRREDGVHLTIAGGNRLAEAVWAAIAPAWGLE